MAVADHFDTVQKIYIAFYQRPADPAGLHYWSQRIDLANGDLGAVIDAFANSEEAVRLYFPEADPLENTLYDLIDADSVGGLIDSIYQALFNRLPDAGGKEFYVNGFIDGTFTAADIMLNVLNGAQNDDAVAVANKLEVSTLFTAALDPELDGIGPFNATYDANDELTARDWLAAVTADPTTRMTEAQVVEDVQTLIADAGDPILDETSGGTFTLTTDQDILVGTSGNDTFNAAAVNILGQDANTLQAFDSINGGAGTDTLNIYVKEDGFNQNQVGTVSSIEIVNVYNTEANYEDFANNDGIDASKFGGVQQLWQIDGASDITKLASTTVAGFRNLDEEEEAIDIEAAAGASSITIALDNAEGEEVDFDVSGLSLNTVNISGDLAYDTTDACDNPIVKNGTVELDVNGGQGTKFTLNSTLNVDLEIGDAENFTEVDATATTGNVEVSANWGQLQTVLTGAGNDEIDETGFVTTATKAALINAGNGDNEVDVWTDGVGTTTVTTGEGDDEIDVGGASKTLVINAGAGADELYFGEDFQGEGDTATATVTVDMGAGDDDVEFANLIMADLPAAWVIDGGDGYDNVFLGAGAGRTFTAGDYVTLNESLKNFESLELYAGADQEFTVDASRLASYESISFVGEGANTITVNKVAADQTIGINNSWGEATLNVTAAGYTDANVDGDAADTGDAYGGDLNVAVDSYFVGAAHVAAKGNALNLTVDAGEAGAVSVAGDIKTLNATLNAEVITNGAECPDDLEDVGAEGVFLFVDTAEFTAALTTINLSGVGEAFVSNREGSKLATIDASGLTNIDWDGDAGEVIVGNALDYFTDNASVAETIKLGAGYDTLTFNWYDGIDSADRWGSTYAKMDTVEGLTLVAEADAPTQLNWDASDSILVSTDILSQLGATFEKLSTAEAAAVSSASSLGLALQTVAQNTSKDYVVFNYGSNTYIYGDTGGLSDTELVYAANDQLDDSDLVIKLTGTVDLNLLLDSLAA
ncbi:beta strand repeat-containing protein [Aromatoleum aromaticum]|uniref:beta strand repeat-containing protein n=1 Tax=Aromatoleum aromaticum TaxID=551760 RepID=UPI00145939C0|nr:hypothetical protein [Aromatoleum aromaticum]NMG56568.1 hypothetical protein [Aromatoleum aromaticum]